MNANAQRAQAISGSGVTAAELETLMIDFMARELKLSRDEIETDVEFTQYDFDSALALSMVAELEDKLKCKLSPTLSYNYPTIAQLAEHLAENHAGGN